MIQSISLQTPRQLYNTTVDSNCGIITRLVVGGILVALGPVLAHFTGLSSMTLYLSIPGGALFLWGMLSLALKKDHPRAANAASLTSNSIERSVTKRPPPHLQAFEQAITTLHVERIRGLVGANRHLVNEILPDSQTHALHYLFGTRLRDPDEIRKVIEILRILAPLENHLNQRDRLGRTPLFYVCQSQHLSPENRSTLIRELTFFGAEVEMRYRLFPGGPEVNILHVLLSVNDDPDSLSELIESFPGSVAPRCYKNATVTHLAAFFRRPDCLERIHKQHNGAENLGVLDRGGLTPFMALGCRSHGDKTYIKCRQFFERVSTITPLRLQLFQQNLGKNKRHYTK